MRDSLPSPQPTDIPELTNQDSVSLFKEDTEIHCKEAASAPTYLECTFDKAFRNSLYYLFK